VEEGLAGVWAECAIVLEEKGREVGGKLCGLLWIAHGKLGDERDELAKVGGVVVWADGEELSDAVVVVVLLQELLAVPGGVALDQILQLGQVRGEEGSPSHRTGSSSPRLVIYLIQRHYVLSAQVVAAAVGAGALSGAGPALRPPRPPRPRPRPRGPPRPPRAGFASPSPVGLPESHSRLPIFSIFLRAFCSRVRSTPSCTLRVCACLTRSASCVFLNASSSALTSWGQ